MIKRAHTSTSVASASMTDTLRVLWRVMYRIDWMMERVLRVPTATLGRSGVKRKKFLGLTTIWQSPIRMYRQSMIRTYNVVVSCIQRLEQTSCSPATSKYHESFLFRVKGHLWPRVLVMLSYKIEYAKTTDHCNECSPANELEESLPSRRTRRGKRRDGGLVYKWPVRYLEMKQEINVLTWLDSVASVRWSEDVCIESIGRDLYLCSKAGRTLATEPGRVTDLNSWCCILGCIRHESGRDRPKVFTFTVRAMNSVTPR